MARVDGLLELVAKFSEPPSRLPVPCQPLRFALYIMSSFIYPVDSFYLIETRPSMTKTAVSVPQQTYRS